MKVETGISDRVHQIVLEPPALAAALARLLDDTALCEKMAAAAQVRVAAFKAGAVVSRIEAVYRALLTQ